MQNGSRSRLNDPVGDDLGRYFDAKFGQEAVKVLPGQYYVTGENKLIVTVLGSCVSACIYDPITEIGGMNHFMLPVMSAHDKSTVQSARYGIHAMELLINQCIQMGAAKSRLVAKVFGGGKIMTGVNYNDVGTMNAEFVVDFLQTEKIQIIGSDLLNTYARKIYFMPATGCVLMKRVRDFDNAKLIERERALCQRFNREVSAGGSVELFN